MDYPKHNVPPTSQLLTACEVLCWIGYRRVISKEQYFMPPSAEGVLGLNIPDLEAFLHASIPEPKPLQSPMDVAERDLITALRGGSVKALYIDNTTGMRVEVPKSDYEADVAVNVRGSLEPNGSMDMDRHMLARSQPQRGRLWFLASEMLAQWPLEAAPKPGKSSQITVDTWILEAYQDARNKGAAPPKQEVLRQDCAAAVQATSRQVKIAFNKIPDTLKLSRGKPRSNQT